MKKIITIVSAVLLAASAVAQTLNVAVGNVTYQFPASQTGDMTYSDGTTLTIMGKAFTLTDISSMYIDDTSVTDNTVGIVFATDTVNITVAGNIAQYMTIESSKAHLSIIQSDDVAEEIVYTASGSASDGELYMAGSYKCELDLNGLTLTNATPVYSGPAINIQNGKRIDISVKSGTTNTLTDASGGDHKACFLIKGHAEFKGKGTLNVYGKTKHAIKSNDYMETKNCTINVLEAAGDGLHANQYFLMESGTINISGVADDGIQTEIDDTETGSTGDMSLINSDGTHEDEDSGNIYLQGGTVNVSITAAGAKGIKAEGDLKITDGTITVETTGNGTYEEETDGTFETKACSGLSADANLVISGGTITLTSSGSGGKGAKCDGDLTISGGTITAVTSGGLYFYDGTTEEHNSSINTDNYDSNYYSSPKGVKAAGNITISGGTVNVTTSGRNGEGIESKAVMTITDGNVTVNSYDDGLNSSSHMYLQGGYVFSHATNNDGIDANGNCYVQGGVVYAITTANGEKAIDANTEDHYSLYIQGGTLIAISDMESGATLTQACYTTGSSSSGPGGQGGPGQSSSSSSSSGYQTNTWYALYNGSDLALAFKTPSGGSSIVVSTSSTPSLTSGVTVSGGTEYFDGMANIGCSVSGGSSVTLSTYSSSSQGGGGR